MDALADYLDMDCANAREVISALLDGEDPGPGGAEAGWHLAGCAACRAWRDAAHDVTRRARLGLAEPVPDRTREILAAVQSRRRLARKARPLTAARAGLVAVAAGQLLLTLPFLLAGHDHGAPEHIAHEMGSLDAALAVGFAVAAWRPARALGMRTLVGAAAALLMTTAVIDLLSGRTSVGEEAPHLLAVAGWLMIRYVAAATPPAAGDPRRAPAPALWSWRQILPGTGRRSPATAATAAAAAMTAAATTAATTTAATTTAAAGAVGRAVATAAAGPPAGPLANLADAHAACGCVASQCSCPGCAAPRHAAAS